MKKTIILYWVVTAIFCGVFLTTGTLYLLHNAVMVAKFRSLGYPMYVLDIIGTAKLIGAVVLLVPAFGRMGAIGRLKEWAYAGFAFDLIGGFWSHLVVRGIGGALPLLVPVSLLLLSYLFYRRMIEMR